MSMETTLAEEEKTISSRSGRASETTICARNKEIEEYRSLSLSLRCTSCVQKLGFGYIDINNSTILEAQMGTLLAPKCRYRGGGEGGGGGGGEFLIIQYVGVVTVEGITYVLDVPASLFVEGITVVQDSIFV
ncbi:hypothetical protein Scep_014200 [Stephania cephalantha]|uniref:Uncharacterized protein n=1 Tax=Stephania cephalantha TaxID=152367 RepID=A0AAP0J0U4_9MAGN